ncbi:MAG: SDR family oxidoreductase [Chloroflexi bacterium]|nr:SDR family oxidoreductase [Chloroflexota bacterium]
MDLHGKVALVTGGGRGIGRETALGLARAGADVAVVARSADEVEAVAAEVRDLGRRALALRCDVTSYAEVRGTVDRVAAELGRLDILVNNAGGGEERKPTLESTPDRWANTINLNLLGVYYGCHAALPHLIAAGGGKIVNVGSGMGHSPSPGNLAYNSAKAGVWMFTRGLAQEVWQQGIDVNEVVPGPVLTRLTEDRFTTDAPPPFAPSERVKGPEEVAALILWVVQFPPGGPTGQSFSLARRPLA